MPNDVAEAIAALEARVAALAPAIPPTPLPGFGTIEGTCGRVAPQLDELTPSLLGNVKFDFGYPFVDPVDRPLLTPGAQAILAAGNAGGSSALSEAFAFETLARCEGASLVKTETEITYDEVGPPTDFSVVIGGRKVGVNVTRAAAYPFGTSYPSQSATNLLAARLGNILQSSRNVSAADAWLKQILVVMAFNQQHADTITTAYRLKLGSTVRSDTIVYVIVTDGNDANLYSELA